MKAYILVNTKNGKSLDVVQRIKDKIKEVVMADAIYGKHDVIVILEAPALEQINGAIYTVIERDPDVTRTETSIVLSLT